MKLIDVCIFLSMVGYAIATTCYCTKGDYSRPTCGHPLAVSPTYTCGAKVSGAIYVKNSGYCWGSYWYGSSMSASAISACCKASGTYAHCI